MAPVAVVSLCLLACCRGMLPQPSPFAEDAANERGIVRPVSREPRLADVLAEIEVESEPIQGAPLIFVQIPSAASGPPNAGWSTRR